MNKPILIGIAGGTASGKTSVARKIYEHFNDEKSVIIIREDDYYKFQTIPFEERKKTNYDHPFAFDYELMHKQLDDLLSGKSKEKCLSLRAFSESQKRSAYEKQKGICPVCGKHFELSEMEGDHITPWSKGGKTTPDNLQMLCKGCNKSKSNH